MLLGHRKGTRHGRARRVTSGPHATLTEPEAVQINGQINPVNGVVAVEDMIPAWVTRLHLGKATARPTEEEDTAGRHEGCTGYAGEGRRHRARRLTSVRPIG